MERCVRSMKSALGVLGALLPLCYCGGLIYYFFDLSGSTEQVQKDGLGPTVLGLGIVGLLFCIPLIFKIAKLFARRSTGSDEGGGAPPPGGGLDPDAMIARYLAKQAATPNAPSSRRAGFGQKPT